jgi:hypothetical protein
VAGTDSLSAQRPGDHARVAAEERPDHWYRTAQGQVVAAIAALVLVLVVVSLKHVDVSLRPAEAAEVDAVVARVGGQPQDGPTQFAGRTFHPYRQLSVVGRCLDCAPFPRVPGAVTVVLLLGADANRDDALRTPVTFTGDTVAIGRGGVTHFAIFHLLPGKDGAIASPAKGAFVSLVGDLGDLDDHVTGNEEYTVRVMQMAQAPGG